MLFAANSTNYERGEPREKTTHGSLNTYISRINALVDIMLIFMRVVNRALHRSNWTCKRKTAGSPAKIGGHRKRRIQHRGCQK